MRVASRVSRLERVRLRVAEAPSGCSADHVIHALENASGVRLPHSREEAIAAGFDSWCAAVASCLGMGEGEFLAELKAKAARYRP